jgi:hypothetical protein
MFVMLNGKFKKWQNVGGKSLLLVSGHRAVGRKCFCGPTFVSWLFLQVFIQAHNKHLRTVNSLFVTRYRTGARQSYMFAVRFLTDTRQCIFLTHPGQRTGND